MGLVRLYREPDRREWSLLLQTAYGGRADHQPSLGADPSKALDALLLAGIGCHDEQDWQGQSSLAHWRERVEWA